MSGTNWLTPLRVPGRGERLDEATWWLQSLARVGYVCKGTVYILMGVLAARAAARLGGEFATSRGILLHLVDKPFGTIMLTVAAVGFAGFAAWQVLSAAVDADGYGGGIPGIANRFMQLASAVAYAGLSKLAGHMVLSENAASEDIRQHWVPALMSLPSGHIAVMVAGLSVLGFGLWQFARARPKGLGKRLDLSELSPTACWILLTIGRVGVVARGVVFTVLGWMLARSAYAHVALEDADVGTALRALDRGESGRWALMFVAVGVVSYGLYQFVNARYRRLRERRRPKFTRREEKRTRQDRRWVEAR